MRELRFLIQDVREATDNRDTNGVKDKEIIRYFNDGVRSIQTLIFKNNPLCSYFQEPELYDPLVASREYTLPSDCFGDNAVSMVEVQGAGDDYTPLDRAWPEDNFYGWFTRNKKVVITGDEGTAFPESIRVWYFKRLPRFDKAWGTVTGVVGQVVTITNVDTDFGLVDGYASFKTSAGADKLAGLKIASYTATTVTFAAGVDVSSLVAGDQLVMGSNVSLTVDLPEEVETYLLDYVAKRLSTRNNYSLESSKIAAWTEEAKANIISIFADAGQSVTRTPITDTDFLRV